MDESNLSDHTISMVRANVIGAVAFPLAIAVVLVPFFLIHGRSAFKSGAFGSSMAVFTLVFIISIVLHEALHAVGFIVFGGAPRAAVRFGVDRKTLTPFAGCTAPLRARNYRIACLLPAIVLGLIPAVVAIANGSAALAIYGAVMLGAAGGDFAAVMAMRRVAGDALVLDHPSRVGCRVVTT